MTKCPYARETPNYKYIVECKVGDGRDGGKGLGESKKKCLKDEHKNCPTYKTHDRIAETRMIT